MSDSGTEHFEEPVLKDAIRRIRGGHRARPELRDRVAQMLAQELLAQVSAPVVRASSRRLFIRPWLAIAACLLLAAAAGTYVYLKYFTLDAGRQHGGYFSKENEKIIADMVAAQTRGIANTPGAKPIVAPLDDRAALAKAIDAQSGRRVPVPDFGDHGWKLLSAAICPIGKVTGVQLDYARGNDHLSVLALPASAFVNAREGNEYNFFYDRHPLAGFTHGGSIICVVADPKVRADHAGMLRDRLKAEKTM